MFSKTVFALLFFSAIAFASIPLSIGNLSVSNVSKVYALVHTPDNQVLNIPIKYENGGYQGFINSELAGVYNVTLVVNYRDKGILYSANTSKDILFLNCGQDSDCAYAGNSLSCNLQTKQCSSTRGMQSNLSGLVENQLFLDVNAQSPDFVQITALVGRAQTLNVTASKGNVTSRSLEIKLPVRGEPVPGAIVNAVLPSGKQVSLKTLTDGTAKIFLYGESGIVNGSVVSQAFGAKDFSTETRKPLVVLREARQATAFAANVVAAPIAVASGWGIFTFISSLAILMQSLLAFRLSMSQTQLGNFKLSLQILSFSFLLLAVRKLFGILNEIGIGGSKFELTYAILELMFFIAFFYALNKLGSNIKQAANSSIASNVRELSQKQSI